MEITSYALPNQESGTVARKITDKLYCRFSPSEQFHSDRGRPFQHELVHDMKIMDYFQPLSMRRPGGKVQLYFIWHACHDQPSL